MDNNELVEKHLQCKEENKMNNITIQCDIPNELITHISKQAEEEMIKEIKRQVKNHMLAHQSSYYSFADAKDRDPLNDWVSDLVKETVAESKDLIIEKAAHELSQKMSKSKIVRERFADKLEENL